MLRIEGAWEPTQLKGNYLYWKNPHTGETRKTYISDGYLAGIKKELNKYKKLRSGLGYPWQPTRYESGYVYYTHLISGETTKSYVPVDMQTWARDFFKKMPPVQPSKTRIISLEETGKASYSYISRGNFTELREALSLREQSLQPFQFLGKYTKRIGVVEKVLAGNLIVVDGVVVKIKGAETPIFKKDHQKWLQAKQYTESLVLNRTVILNIDLDNPTDDDGTTLARVMLQGEKNYEKKPPVINLTLPYFKPRMGKSALVGGDVPLYNISSYIGAGITKEIPYDANVANSIQRAGFSPTYDEMQATEIQNAIIKKNRQKQYTMDLMKAQSALPEPQRDRPNEWGIIDTALFPLTFLSYSEGAMRRNLIVASQKGELKEYLAYLNSQIPRPGMPNIPNPKYYTWQDKLTASDTATIIQTFKIISGDKSAGFQPFEYRNSGYTWIKSGDPRDEWQGGFWDRFLTDLNADALTYVSSGTSIFSSQIKLSNGKQFFITPEGEQIFKAVIAKHGFREGRHIFSQMLRTSPDVAKASTWYKGIRIAFTNTGIVPAKYSTDIINAATQAAWKYGVKVPIINPIKFAGSKGYAQISNIAQHLTDIGRKQDVISLEQLIKVRDEYRQLVDRKRLQKQLASADLWILRQEALRESSIKWTGTEITDLLESGLSADEKANRIITQLKIYNKLFAIEESKRGLLTSERKNYMRHILTKEARDSFGLEEKVLGRLAVENLYNIERMNEGTLKSINEIYMKKYGFNLFEPDAFKIMEKRAIEHIESVETYDYLNKIKKEWGVIPVENILTRIPFFGGYFDGVPAGYSRSEIPMLRDVFLPTKLVKLLEENPTLKAHIRTTSPPSYFERALGASDTVQSLWKFSVTFADTAWIPGNIQSGILLVDFWFAGATKFRDYKYAWQELARNSEGLSRLFKMAKTGGTLKDKWGEEIPAEQLIREAREGGILGVEGSMDLSRHFKKGDTLISKFVQAGHWALTNSENMVRLPLYINRRVTMGDTPEQAIAYVNHYHGNYAKSALSPLEDQYATRLFNFYIWYKTVVNVVTHQYTHNPSSLTAPNHLMNTWNGEQGDVEKQYFTGRQLARMMFKIPNTDAYTVPAPFSMMNNFYKWGYILKTTENAFWWTELQKDPELLLRFAKYELNIDWIKRGGGKVTIEGDKATIEYVETGDTITAKLDSNQSRLVFIDDATGQVLKEYPTKNIDGRIGITKEQQPLEKLMGEMGARTLMMPLELALNRDFKFGSAIENPFIWIATQFLYTSRKGYEKVLDPTISPAEKISEMIFGWMIDHLSDNRLIPREADEMVKKAVGIKVWEIERGDYYGCGT